MPTRDFDPLFGEAPEEVRLPKAPLACVLTQVQFEPILMLRSDSFVAQFQERIRSEYPRFEQGRIQVVAPPGFPIQPPEEHFWRFTCSKDEWRVALSPTFISLETRAYTSRSDFVGRMKSLVAALKEVVKSANVTRIGVRYIDHVRSPEIVTMAEMLRPQMLGVADTPLRERMLHAVTEMFCSVREGNLLARWGFLPPNGTHDPNVMPSVPEMSWFLDVDIFKLHERPLPALDPEGIHEDVSSLATRCYAFFRWATTERFLEVYGGPKCSRQ